VAKIVVLARTDRFIAYSKSTTAVLKRRRLSRRLHVVTGHKLTVDPGKGVGEIDKQNSLMPRGDRDSLAIFTIHSIEPSALSNSHETASKGHSAPNALCEKQTEPPSSTCTVQRRERLGFESTAEVPCARTILQYLLGTGDNENCRGHHELIQRQWTFDCVGTHSFHLISHGGGKVAYE
jgi:hypothetical protein